MSRPIDLAHEVHPPALSRVERGEAVPVFSLSSPEDDPLPLDREPKLYAARAPLPSTGVRERIVRGEEGEHQERERAQSVPLKEGTPARRGYDPPREQDEAQEPDQEPTCHVDKDRTGPARATAEVQQRPYEGDERHPG